MDGRINFKRGGNCHREVRISRDTLSRSVGQLEWKYKYGGHSNDDVRTLTGSS